MSNGRTTRRTCGTGTRSHRKGSTSARRRPAASSNANTRALPARRQLPSPPTLPKSPASSAPSTNRASSATSIALEIGSSAPKIRRPSSAERMLRCRKLTAATHWMTRWHKRRSRVERGEHSPCSSLSRQGARQVERSSVPAVRFRAQPLARKYGVGGGRYRAAACTGTGHYRCAAERFRAQHRAAAPDVCSRSRIPRRSCRRRSHALDRDGEVDGSVRSVQVTTGEEPFASAALDAVRRFVFEPATRDGQPVAATIRFDSVALARPNGPGGPAHNLGLRTLCEVSTARNRFDFPFLQDGRLHPAPRSGAAAIRTRGAAAGAELCCRSVRTRGRWA